MIQCPKCNAVNQDGARFCASCDAPLNAPAQQPPVQPYSQQPGSQPMQQAYPQSSAQQPYAAQQPVQQPSMQQPYPQQVSFYAGATPPAPPKKKNTGVIVAVILIALALVIVGVFVAFRLFSVKPDPNDPSLTETPSNAVITTEAESTTLSTDPSSATTEPMNGTAAHDFSILYGEWVDQGGRYDLYIKPDGAFYLALPDGTYTGQVVSNGTDYLLKADNDPAALRDAVIILNSEDSNRFVRLRTADMSAILDFASIPEKSEMFDWIAIGFSSDMLDYYSEYDVCRVDKSDYSVELLMAANYPLRDVKYLELELVDYAQDGTATFKTREMYSQPVMLNRRPLVFDLSNAGDLPTRGVSFVDLDGVTHYFTISFSGLDGSVIYSEFVPY